MGSNNISYNTFEILPTIPSKIFKHLIQNNEDIWKILKYQTPDALLQPDLTTSEKYELVYTYGDFQNGYRLFLQENTEDTFDGASTFLYIYTTEIMPINRMSGIIDVCFEVACHNKHTLLEGGYHRLPYLQREILRCFNGLNVNGVGNLTFDREKSISNRGVSGIYNNKNYIGRKLILSTRSLKKPSSSC